VAKRDTKDGDKAGEKYDERLAIGKDIDRLRRAVRQSPEIALIVLDPLNSYFGPDVDENKAKEIAPVLEQLSAFCADTGVTVIGLIHHSKRSDTDALGKVLGSVRVGGIARAVWEISKDPDDDDLVRMALVKGNLHRKRSGMTYRIEGVDIMIEGQTANIPRVVWGDALEKDANQLLDEQKEKAKEPKDRKRAMARTLLPSMLPGYARDIYAALDAEGIGERTAKAAKQDLGVLVKKLVTGWWWFLPGQEIPGEAKILEDVEAI